jgi:hypothetical protein
MPKRKISCIVAKPLYKRLKRCTTLEILLQRVHTDKKQKKQN